MALEGRIVSRSVSAALCRCFSHSGAEREELDAKIIHHGANKMSKTVIDKSIAQTQAHTVTTLRLVGGTPKQTNLGLLDTVMLILIAKTNAQ